MRTKEEIQAKGREVLDRSRAIQIFHGCFSAHPGAEEDEKERIALEGAARALAWVLGSDEPVIQERETANAEKG